MRGCSGSAMRPAAESAAAAAVLRRGGAIVFPTETLYALGVDALNAGAVRRVVQLKRRPADKPIAVVIANMAMLDHLVTAVPDAARALMARFWPGPLTLVLPPRPGLPGQLTAGDGIGIRISSHPLATAIVEACGAPVTAPSANPDALPAPRTLAAAQAYFGSEVDLYVDGGELPGEPASTVLDVRQGWRVIRAGAVSIAAVRAVIGDEVSAW